MKKWLVGLLVGCFVISAIPATLIIGWRPSLDLVTGYKIYFGPSTKFYTQSIDVGNVTNTTLNFIGNEDLFFIATAYVTNYHGEGYEESVPSNEVEYQFRPAIPAGLRIIH